jgi:hypothetical protein
MLLECYLTPVDVVSVRCEDELVPANRVELFLPLMLCVE